MQIAKSMIVKSFFEPEVISVSKLFMIHPTVCLFVLFFDLVRQGFAIYMKQDPGIKKNTTRISVLSVFMVSLITSLIPLSFSCKWFQWWTLTKNWKLFAHFVINQISQTQKRAFPTYFKTSSVLHIKYSLITSKILSFLRLILYHRRDLSLMIRLCKTNTVFIAAIWLLNMNFSVYWGVTA